MTPPSEPHGPAGGEGPSSLDPALADALRAVLAPLARLALARGVSCGAVEELLKEMFVDEAMRAQGASASGRMVSRISVATGLNRREVFVAALGMLALVGSCTMVRPPAEWKKHCWPIHVSSPMRSAFL